MTAQEAIAAAKAQIEANLIWTLWFAEGDRITDIKPENLADRLTKLAAGAGSGLVFNVSCQIVGAGTQSAKVEATT